MFVLCGKDLQQEVLVRVEHQTSGKTKLLPFLGLFALNFCLLGVRRRTFSLRLFLLLCQQCHQTRWRRYVCWDFFLEIEIKPLFFSNFSWVQHHCQQFWLPDVQAGSWTQVKQKKESIAHWTFCCRVLYIKLLRQIYSGMLWARWTGETCSKMYVKTRSSVLFFRSPYFNDFKPKLPDSWESCSRGSGRSHGGSLENLQQAKVKARISCPKLSAQFYQWHPGLQSCSSSKTSLTTSATRSKWDGRRIANIAFLLPPFCQVSWVWDSETVSGSVCHPENPYRDGQWRQTGWGRQHIYYLQSEIDTRRCDGMWKNLYFLFFSKQNLISGETTVGGRNWGGSGLHALWLSSRPVSHSEV